MISYPPIHAYPKDSAFIVKQIEGDWFNNDLHWHEENELIYFNEGSGYILINNKEFPFEQGDVLFLGSNLIHKYQINNNGTTNAVVVLFGSDFLGSDFMLLPECQQISRLLQNAKQGLQFFGKTKNNLQSLIAKLPIASGIDKLIRLLQCLQAMSVSEERTTISGESLPAAYTIKGEWIDRVFQFTGEYFQTHITLQQAASAVCMSIPSFCHYFKQCTHKTYIDYLNEIRINFACRRLRETNQSVSEIGYESGYNTIAHFHRQFHKLKNTTPLRYRRAHRSLPYSINLKAI